MCHEYEILISQAIDHELSKEEEEKLVAHLRVCQSCKEEYEALKGLKAWLGSSEKSDLPVGFHEALMDKINAEATRKIEEKKVKKHYLKPLTGMVAGLFVGGALIYQLISLSGSGMMKMGAKQDTSMARATDEMTEEVACDSEEIKSEMAIDGHYKIGEGTSQEEVMEEALDACEEEKWSIKVTDPSGMILALSDYLEKQQIVYEVSGDKVTIWTANQQESLEKWLIDYGAEVTKGQEEKQEDVIVLLFDKS